LTTIPGTERAIEMQTLMPEILYFPTYQVSTATGGGAIGNRNSNSINLRGIKMDISVTNTYTIPVVFHWVLLQTKSRQLDPDEVYIDFFRDTFSQATRQLDFVDYPNPTDPYMPQYDKYPINPDKYFVITHRRVILDPTCLRGYDATPSLVLNRTGSKEGRIRYVHKKYYKVNKILGFDGGTDEFPHFPIIFAAWAQNLDKKDHDELQDGSPGRINVNAYYTHYFENE